MLKLLTLGCYMFSMATLIQVHVIVEGIGLLWDIFGLH